MMKKAVGIYINKNLLQLVVLSKGLTKPKLVTVGSIKIPADVTIVGGPPSQKQLTPFQLSTREFLIERNIKEGEVVAAALPPEVIVIRYFQMPRLISQEQKTAVPFEARKYLPYKLEDTTFAYTISYDKVASNKMAVTFVAAEKASVAGYIRFFENVGLKVGYLEAVPYSLMRFLYYTKEVEPIQTVALVYVSQDLAIINLVRNKVLYLTRNMSFTSKVSQAAQAFLPQTTPATSEEASETAKLDGLLAEIRLSFDYFHRQFPEEKIEKMLIWSDDKKLRDWSQNAGKDLSVPTRAFNPFEVIEGGEDCLVEYATGCGLALRHLHEPLKDVNLSPGFKKIEIEQLAKVAVLQVCVAIVALLIANLLGSGTPRALRKELDSIIKQWPSSQQQLQNLSKADMQNFKQKIQEKFNYLQNLIENKISLTSKLNRIAKLLPEGLWLRELNYYKPKGKVRQAMILKGYASQTKGEDQIKTINAFLENLKKDREFSYGFIDIKLDSIINEKYAGISVTSFQISCSTE